MITNETSDQVESSQNERLLINGVLARPVTYDGNESIKASSMLIPEGYTVEHLPWEQTLDTPLRKRAIRLFNDIDSLVAYTLHHGTKTNTTVWVDDNESRIIQSSFVDVIFDDHSQKHAGWAEHKAELKLKKSDQLKTWLASNTRDYNQFNFSEFIEDNIRDIITPDASTLLEIVSTLQSKNKVSFDSAVRLDNGAVQVRYSEEVSATAGKQGTLEIPQVFKIAVPIFEYGTRYAIEARLRYRIRNGELTLSYRLERINDIVRDALITRGDSVINTLRAKLEESGIPVYFGSNKDMPRFATFNDNYE